MPVHIPTTTELYTYLCGYNGKQRSYILQNWPNEIYVDHKHSLSSIFSALLEPCTISSLHVAEQLLAKHPYELQKAPTKEDWWAYVLSSTLYASRYSTPVFSQQMDRVLTILSHFKKQSQTLNKRLFSDISDLPDYLTLTLVAEWAKRLNSVESLPIPHPHHFVAFFLYTRFRRSLAKQISDPITALLYSEELTNNLSTLDAFGQSWLPLFALTEKSDLFKTVILKIPFLHKKYLEYQFAGPSLTPLIAL